MFPSFYGSSDDQQCNGREQVNGPQPVAVKVDMIATMAKFQQNQYLFLV